MNRTRLSWLRGSGAVILVVFTFVLTCREGRAGAALGESGGVLELSVEPRDVVVSVGGSAVLDCAAQSSEHNRSRIMVQWQDEHGQPVTFIGDQYRSQLTNNSLYVTGVGAKIGGGGGEGTYRCRATLPNGWSVVSRSARVSAAELDGWHEEPADSAVESGGRAHLACRARSRPVARVRWLKDGRPLHVDDLRMVVLPSGALEIDDVQERDEGAYACEASLPGGGSQQSRAAQLKVEAAAAPPPPDDDDDEEPTTPTFAARPRSQRARLGDAVTLECAANGRPRPRVTWLKDGRAVDLADLDTRYALLAGTTSLQVRDVQERDAGAYACRAENGAEDGEDAVAQLQVLVPPRFVRRPHDRVAPLNADTEFECELHGVPEPHVTWLKNGEQITYNDYLTLVGPPPVYNLRIAGLIDTDTGIFQCVAANDAGNVQAAARLKVHQPDQLGKRKKVRGGGPFGGAGGGKKPGKTFAHDVFSSLVSGGHGGGSSSAGAVVDPHAVWTSLRAEPPSPALPPPLGPALTAYTPPPPSFAGNAEQEELDAHDNEEKGTPAMTAAAGARPGRPRDLRAVIVKARFVTLSWRAPATGADVGSYVVYWREEGSRRERVMNATRGRANAGSGASGSGGGGAEQEANVGGLAPGRVYVFRVAARSSRGAAATPLLGPPSDTLTVATQAEEHVPSAPREVHAHATGAHSLAVRWLAPLQANGRVRLYRVHYADGERGEEQHVDVPADRHDIELMGLACFVEYAVWVAAVNERGAGASSRDAVTRTLGAAPSEPPQNVTVEVAAAAGGSSALVVRWRPPPLRSRNGLVTGYRLRYRASGRRGDTITTPGDALQYVLGGLERATTYQVRVSAINANGSGPATDWLACDTLERELDESRVPREPSPLRVRAAATSIHVSWAAPPTTDNIVVRRYLLGWGKGIPDTFAHELDERTRHYVIERLEPNSEYVISLRASNDVGPGPARYANVRTRGDADPDDELDEDAGLLEGGGGASTLMPPVGLKAHVLGSTTVVLYWTDATLNKAQQQRADDQRYYVVRYGATADGGGAAPASVAAHAPASPPPKYRTHNSTDMNCMISELRPNTHYEFAVKLVKGRRESPWSMVVSNVTMSSAPGGAPRDLAATAPHPADGLRLTWQPPRHTNGPITGYVIFYTTDASRRDRDWLVEGVLGDRHAASLHGLRPDTPYHLKIQARNSKGVGPFSPTLSYTTPPPSSGATYGAGDGGGGASDDGRADRANGLLSAGNVTLYLIIGGSVVGATACAVLVTVLCCRRATDPRSTPDRSASAAKKHASAHQHHGGVKPPDLWIHHDQMELKALDGGGKGGAGGDEASSSGVATLPRSTHTDYVDQQQATSRTPHHHLHHHGGNNSLDKRTYMPSYMGEYESHSQHALPHVRARPEPHVTVDPSRGGTSPSSREYPLATATPVNSAGVYPTPRAQYTVSRAHVTLDECPYAPAHTAYEPPSGGYGQTGTYAAGVSVLPPPPTGASSVLASELAASAKRPPGHPLKSFSVPAPPPVSAPGTPQSKHAAVAGTATGASPAHVVVRPTAGAGSPYKKLCGASGGGGGSPCGTSRISAGAPPPHTAEEVRPLAPSQSTEELNQEMANLEGLMKDLSAITASQFEC